MGESAVMMSYIYSFEDTRWPCEEDERNGFYKRLVEREADVVRCRGWPKVSGSFSD